MLTVSLYNVYKLKCSYKSNTFICTMLLRVDIVTMQLYKCIEIQGDLYLDLQWGGQTWGQQVKNSLRSYETGTVRRTRLWEQEIPSYLRWHQILGFSIITVHKGKRVMERDGKICSGVFLVMSAVWRWAMKQWWNWGLRLGFKRVQIMTWHELRLISVSCEENSTSLANIKMRIGVT